MGLVRLTSGFNLWFTLADLVTARLGGYGVPEVFEAFRVDPIGQLPTLKALLPRRRSTSTRAGTTCSGLPSRSDIECGGPTTSSPTNSVASRTF